MRMSEEETAWISNEYSDCPLFAAVKSFVRDVSGINGMPAGHPSLVFYLAVFAIDHIKCINNRKRRLEKCRILKNEIIYHLKLNQYSDENKLAAVIIYCVQYGLEALSFSRCIKEIFIMSEHINELVTDQTTKDKIREISRKCFWGEDFQKWFVGYYEGKEFISETIIAKLREMRKANPPKEEVVKKTGRGNRNKELFTDESLKEQKINEFRELFAKRNLSMKNISLRSSDYEDVILSFYRDMKTNQIIDSYKNPKGYLRFMKAAGVTFDSTDSNVEKKLRKIL